MGMGSARIGAVRGRGAALAMAVTAGMLLTGCQGAGNAPASTGGQSTGQFDGAAAETPAPSVKVTVSVPQGAKDVRPDQELTVTAEGGTLDNVVLTGADGKEVEGSGDETSWKLSELLAPGTAYTLQVTAKDGSGASTTQTYGFATLKPGVEATYNVWPDKMTVGVGMPVMVNFDSAVKTPAMRAAVEQRMKVTTTPRTEGSWGWVGDTQLYWRPKTYWKPNTKVNVEAPLRGVQTGEKKWVGQNKAASFTIAKRARISTVDLRNHHMVVRDDGEIVGRYAISAGRPTAKYETRSGVKVITEKRPHMVMSSETLGVKEGQPGYYRTEVKWAMRVTNTGEFFHAAPWSVWAQGERNVSHGCVNMGPRSAREFFTSSLIGDVADFKNSDREMNPGDGVSVWNFTWEQWKTHSALHTRSKKAPATQSPAPSATAAPDDEPTGAASPASTGRAA